MKEKCCTIKYIDTYIYLAHDVMFTQMSGKKGIEKFGEISVAAMFKEYQQFNDGPMPGNLVFGPIDID